MQKTICDRCGQEVEPMELEEDEVEWEVLPVAKRMLPITGDQGGAIKAPVDLCWDCVLDLVFEIVLRADDKG